MRPPELKNPDNQSGRPMPLEISANKDYRRVWGILEWHELSDVPIPELFSYCHGLKCAILSLGFLGLIGNRVFAVAPSIFYVPRKLD